MYVSQSFINGTGKISAQQKKKHSLLLEFVFINLLYIFTIHLFKSE